jgi:hypothetical protein
MLVIQDHEKRIWFMDLNRDEVLKPLFIARWVKIKEDKFIASTEEAIYFFQIEQIQNYIPLEKPLGIVDPQLRPIQVFRTIDFVLSQGFSYSNGLIFIGTAESQIAFYDLEFKLHLTTWEGFESAISGGNLPIHSLDACEDKLVIANSLRSMEGEPELMQLRILNFTVDHKMVLREIADRFEQGTVGWQRRAMGRFLRMPREMREQIYMKLQEILKAENVEYCGSGEDAFHANKPRRSTPEQKARAIRNFLSDNREKTDT